VRTVQKHGKKSKKKTADEPYSFILLLTSKNEKDDVIEGMNAGADDYITKPFYPHELQVRLRAGQRIVDLNRELINAKNALKKQATHDSLTGLLNRPAIIERLNQEMERRKRYQQNLCVGIMDIDHFKNVNDTYGHNVGDQVLKSTAERIHSALRPYDSFGRYGGEEFLIIMSDCDCDDMSKHYDRLKECLAGQPIETSKGPLSITASFGVGITPTGQDIDPEALIGIADKALYRAKNKGRNRVELEFAGKGKA
jgi:diguanylate cyclase (GGDEF)-like protein